MLPKTFLSFLLALFITPSYGQSIEWEKTYGGSDIESLYSLKRTSDGGLLGFGYSYSSDSLVSANYGSIDYWVIKTTGNGTLEWEGNYGGSAEDYARYATQTSDKGYLLMGDSESSDHDVSSNKGMDDFWVVKLDSSGGFQWEENYGGSSGDQGWKIMETSDGGYVMGGDTRSSGGDVSQNNGGSDYWLVKLDSLRNIEWERSYGGSNDDRLKSFIRTDDGGFALFGHSASNDGDVSGNNGGDDYWLVRTDSMGNIEWERNYGGSNDEIGYNLRQEENGNLILTGHTRSSDGDVSNNHGSYDYWVVKTDSIGSIIWEKNYGGSDMDRAYDIKINNDGFIISGESQSNDFDVGGNNGQQDAWIVDLDDNGSLLWEKNYGGSQGEIGWSAIVDQTNGYYVGGSAESSDGDVSKNYGSLDYWILELGCDSSTNSYLTKEECGKYTVPSGDTTYSSSGVYYDTIPNSFGCDSIIEIDLTIQDSSSESINETACNSYTVPSGDTTYTSSGVYHDTLINNAGCDSIIEIDLTINSVDTSVTQLSSTELEADETGASYQWLDCNEGYAPLSGDTAKTFSSPSNGSYAVEVTKNGCTDTSSCHQITGVGIAENDLESQVSVHPNPTTNKVTVEIPDRKERLHMVLRDASGRKVRERDIDNPSRFKLELGQEEGLYIVELRGDDGKNAVIRVVKE